MRPRNVLILVVILAVAITVFFLTRPAEETTTEIDPKERVWDFEMDDLTHIIIELPKLEMSESFVIHEDRQWYFDDPPGPQVDPDRWGGGVPLILSGPLTERSICKDATAELLDAYGFTVPQMTITLTTGDEEITIEVGDKSPSGSTYYIRLADSDDVYAIDYTWYDVLERLVLEPPYVSEEEE